MDYVLHQAAIPSVPRSVKDPVTSNRANIDASLNVLVAARDAGVKRLVYAGSSSAYGDTPTLPKREDMPTNPLSPYALQKLVARTVRSDVHAPVRLRNGDHPLFQRLRAAPGSRVAVLGGDLRSSPTALIQGRRPVIYGDGEQTRDFTYIANVVDGVLRAAEAPNAAGEVINVATGGRISLNELLRTMNRIVGTDVKAEYKDPRAGDVRDSQADISKAKTLLGYVPIVGLEEGLRRRSSGAGRNSAERLCRLSCGPLPSCRLCPSVFKPIVANNWKLP